jgi:folylpolyglutamate synthase/dihydropteroate synthase
MLLLTNTYVFFMQVDVAIMEVGLGGKYDATNVVCIVFISAEVYWSNIT